MAGRITFWQSPQSGPQHGTLPSAFRWKGGAAVNKPTIAILSLAAIVLNVIAFVGYGPAVATHLFGCRSSLYGPPATGCAPATATAINIGIALYVGGIVAALLAWIGGLIKTGRIGRWGWFVVVLLLSPLGSLLYGLVGPSGRKD
jgi:hypothetical protein